MNRKLILKIPRFDPFGANLAQPESKSNPSVNVLRNNLLLEAWSLVTEVALLIYPYDDQLGKKLFFNGSGSNFTSWFTQDNLLTTGDGWDDLKEAQNVIFGDLSKPPNEMNTVIACFKRLFFSFASFFIHKNTASRQEKSYFGPKCVELVLIVTNPGLF